MPNSRNANTDPPITVIARLVSPIRRDANTPPKNTTAIDPRIQPVRRMFARTAGSSRGGVGVSIVIRIVTRTVT